MVAAIIVTAAGLVMIVVPGPAVIVIPVGLAMLSLEFAWAARLTRLALKGGAQAGEAIQTAIRTGASGGRRQPSPWRRRVVGAILIF